MPGEYNQRCPHAKAARSSSPTTMKHRVRLYSTALLLAAAPFVAVSCSKQEESTTPAAGGGGASKSAAVVSAPVSAAWGFTASLPKTTEGFVSFYRLGDLVINFKNSGFVKKLLTIPEVGQQINPDQIQTMLDNNAQLKDVLTLFSSEVVISMQEGFTTNAATIAKSLMPLMQAAVTAGAAQRASGDTSGPPPWMSIMEKNPAAISAAVQALVETDIPPVMIGLKAGSAKDRLDAMIKSGLEQMPPDAKQALETGSFKLSGKYEFQTLTFKAAKAIPPDAEQGVRAQLTQLVGDPAKAASLTGKLLAKTVELSFGWVDDTLVIGLGKDHSHVKLATGDGVMSLPEIAARAGAWEAKKPISFGYASKKTNEEFAAVLENLPEMMLSLMQTGSSQAPFPMEPLITDLKKLSTRAKALWPPKFTASVGATWWDGGLHIESFGGPVMEAYDSSKPLIYGSLAGPATVLLSETRVNEASSDKAFAFIEEVASTMYTSFQTNIVPNLPDDAKQKVGMAGIALPMIKELWTSIQVFRSALGSESALLVNLDGAMPPLPQVPEEFKNVKVPRVLVVSDLKDREKLGAAWLGMAKVINGVAALAQAPVKPEPVEKKEGDVTMWGLPLPMDTGDLWPHTAVAGNRWYLGTSPSFTKEAAAKTPAPSGPPSGMHFRLNFNALWDYVNSVSGVVPIQAEEKQKLMLALDFLKVLSEIDARSGQDKGDSHVKVLIGIKDLN
jgi:hypothetical protein